MPGSANVLERKMGEFKKSSLRVFLSLETKLVLEKRFSKAVTPKRTSTIQWTLALLAEVIRRRVYVASEGAFSSLDAVASPALRDIETILAKVVFLIPQRALKDEREQLDGGFRFVLLRMLDVPIKSPPEKWGLYQVMLNRGIP